MRSQAASAETTAGRRERRLLLRLGQPPGAVARAAAARRVRGPQHANQVHVVLDGRDAGARAVADDRLDELDLALALGVLPEHDRLAESRRRAVGFISCWGVIVSIDADDSIGNSTMSSDTPCAAQRSRRAVSASTVQLAGSAPFSGIPADVIDAVPLEVLQARRTSVGPR